MLLRIEYTDGDMWSTLLVFGHFVFKNIQTYFFEIEIFEFKKTAIAPLQF